MSSVPFSLLAANAVGAWLWAGLPALQAASSALPATPVPQPDTCLLTEERAAPPPSPRPPAAGRIFHADNSGFLPGFFVTFQNVRFTGGSAPLLGGAFFNQGKMQVRACLPACPPCEAGVPLFLLLLSSLHAARAPWLHSRAPQFDQQHCNCSVVQLCTACEARSL